VFALKPLPAEARIRDTLTYVQNSKITYSSMQDCAMPYVGVVGPMDCADNKTGTVKTVSYTHEGVPGTIMWFKTGLIGVDVGDELVAHPHVAADLQRKDEMLHNKLDHVRVMPTFDGSKWSLSVVQNVQENPNGSGLAILENDTRQIHAVENIRRSLGKIDTIFVVHDECRWPPSGAAHVASLMRALDQCKCHHGTLTDDIVWGGIDEHDDSISWP
jgi:hypothetical protein